MFTIDRFTQCRCVDMAVRTLFPYGRQNMMDLLLAQDASFGHEAVDLIALTTFTARSM